MSHLEEICALKTLGTEKEEFFDSIVNIAMSIFDVPLASIGFFNNDEFWLKSCVGSSVSKVPTRDTVCKYFLNSEKSYLLINSPTKKKFFRNNPLVKREGIKFYASAPIVSQTNRVLGTISIAGYKPKYNLCNNKVHSLKTLAEVISNELYFRALKSSIRVNLKAEKKILRSFNDVLLGSLFEMKIKGNRLRKIKFLNQNHVELFPNACSQIIYKKPMYLFRQIDERDFSQFVSNLVNGIMSQIPIHLHYRVKGTDGEVRWHSLRASPFRISEDESKWFCVIEDVTLVKEYMDTVKSIMFSVSHEIRKPASNILGLIDIMTKEKMSKKELMNLIEHLHYSAVELDTTIHKINAEVFEVKARLESFQLG